MTLRTNLIANPSFETGILGNWNTNGSNPSGNPLDREQSGTAGNGSTVTPPQGSWYAYARRTSAGQLNFFNTTNMPVTPGALYTASAYVNRDGTNQVALDIDWYTSASAYISSSTGTLTPATGTWGRISSTGTAPSNAAFARFYMRFVNQGANQYIRIDGAMFEAGVLGPYFDGSFPGCEWASVAHASTSSESTGYRRNLVINPSFEINAAGYTIGYTRTGATVSSSVAVSNSVAAGVGTTYGFVNVAGDGATTSPDVVVRGANVKVTPGEQYAFSSMFQTSGTGAFTAWCGIDWLDANGTQLTTGGSSTGASFLTSNSFARSPTLVATAPAGAYFARPSLWGKAPTDTSQRSFRFDALLFEEAPAGPYFDGSFPDSDWVGPANASPSVTVATIVYAGAASTTSSSTSTAAANLAPGRLAASTTSASVVATDGSVGRSGTVTTSSPSTSTAAALRITTGAAVTSSPSSTGLAADSPGTATTAAPSTSSADARLISPVRTELTVAPSSAVASGDTVPASTTQTTSPSSSTATANLTMPVGTTTSSPSTTTVTPFVDKQAAVTTSSASSSSAGSTQYALVKAVTTSPSTATADGYRVARAAVTTTSLSYSAALPDGPTVTVSYGYATATAGLLTEAQAVTSSSSTDSVGGYADMPVAALACAASSTVAELFAVIALGAVTLSESDTFASAGPPTKLAVIATSSSSSATVSSQLVVPVAINGVGVIRPTATASAFVFTPVFKAPAGPVKAQAPRPVMRLLIAETRTGRIGWELPYTQVQWNDPLNRVGTMTATLTLDEVLESVYAQGAADPAKALRETLTGPMRFSYVITYGNAPVWAGPMQPAVTFQADTDDVQVGGSQMESLYDQRVLIGQAAASVALNSADRDVVFRQCTPAGALLRAALHAGDTSGGRPARGLPITCQNPPAQLGDQDFTYRSYDLVTAWKAMTDLMDRDDGPDMRLAPYLVEGPDGLYCQWDLQIGTPYLPSSAVAGDDGPLPWTFTDATSRIEVATDAVGLATTYYAAGDGQDRAKLVTSAGSSRLTDLGWPALEKVSTDHASETDADKLAALTRGLITAHETPTNEWKVSTPIDGANPLGSFRAGDEALLDIRRHALIEPGGYRRRITEVSHDGGPFVALTCAPDDQEMAGV